MSFSDKREACIVKIDLTQMESEMRSPKMTSLLNSGFSIASCVPVSEEGLPTMLIILEKKFDQKSNIIKQMIVTLLILLVAIKYYEVFN